MNQILLQANAGTSKFSIAPMMGYTDRHFRVLARAVAPNAILYTQMLVADAIMHNPNLKSTFGQDHQLGQVILQLGGSNPVSLKYAAKLAEDFGYAGINLNVGCPSHKVKLAGIGACLLKTPGVVAECIAEMKSVVAIPVTVKTRIGVDEFDSLIFLLSWIKQVSDSGCDGFIFHARKAWLKGLNPRQNRCVPPLNYQRVLEVKGHFPDLYIGINGGINSFDQAQAFLGHYAEVMLGRQGYKSLQLVSQLSRGSRRPAIMAKPLKQYIQYIKQQLPNCRLHHMLKHCMGLYHDQHQAKLWRQTVARCMVQQDLNELSLLIELSEKLDAANQLNGCNDEKQVKLSI